MTDGSQKTEEQFYEAGRLADIAPGETRQVTIAGHAVLLCHVDGAVTAIQATCSHYHAALERGRIRNGWITCPWHGARFDVKSGRCAGNLYPALKSYPVRIEDDRLLVGVSGDPPGFV